MGDQEKQRMNIFDILFIILSFIGFNLLLPKDSYQKKSLFALALIMAYNSSLAHTQISPIVKVLFFTIFIQICLCGLVVQGRRQISNFLKKRFIFQQKIINQWKIILALVILILFTSLFFCVLYLFISISDLLPMFLLLLSIFIFVALIDICFFRNATNSIRRKTFHFVPVLISPIMIIIDYKLALILSTFAFSIFWIFEIVRYFGKLANEADKEVYDENVELVSKEEKLTISQSMLTHFILFTDKLNHKYIKDFKLFKWMESLNSSREPHFWFTHLSLIVGLSLTFLYFPYAGQNIKQPYINKLLCQNMSIILTIADAIAAVVGSKLGKNSYKIPYTNKKTIEGFVGFVCTSLMLQVLFLYFLNGRVQIWFCIVSSVMCGFGQLFSGDLDNVGTGLVFIGSYQIYTAIF